MPPEPNAVINARALRRTMSPPELKLWQWMRTRPNGLKFRRQHPLGRFVLDFYCAAARLAIEVDGAGHDGSAAQDYDAARDDWCAGQGIATLRFAASDVMKDLDGVTRAILDRAGPSNAAPLHQPSAGPPPQRAGEDLHIHPIAHVHGGRSAAIDDDWDRETAVIELVDGFGEEALYGLADFSHVEIAFVFDQVPPDKVETGARHPRNRADWPLVGIFAQRGKNRPNRIGITVCRVERIEGTRLHVRGLDAIDGTPVIDIKPVMREFLPRGEIRQPDWATELMAGYWRAPDR